MFELIQMSKNTRGKDSRTINYKGIGKIEIKTIQRETEIDGVTPLTAKDAEGRLITRPEQVEEIVSDGCITSIDEAMELVGGNQQRLLDFFAYGFNRDAYQTEADKDELDAFTVGLDEAKAKARKTAIRALAKTLEIGILDAAEIVKAATPVAEPVAQ